jgi:hypothetical protein
MREFWTADGWTITEGLVRDVEYRAGLYKTPGAVGEDADVSNRTGNLWRPKVHGPGSFVLNIWLGSNDRATVEAYYDEVQRALVHPWRQTLFERGLANGTVRRCLGDVVAALEPQPSGQSLMRMSIEVNVPAAYWDGTVDRNAGIAMPGAAANGSVDLALTPFAASTAPMEKLTYKVTGPIDNPTVTDRTDFANGEWLWYAGSIPAGQSLVVNSDTWQVTGLGGFVPNVAALNFSDRRFLWVPSARPGAVPTVRLTGSNVTAATRLDVSGREAFLL